MADTDLVFGSLGDPSTDLRFGAAAANPLDLVFSYPASEVTTDLIFGTAGDTPPPPDAPATISVSFGTLSVAVEATYVSDTTRPLVLEKPGMWQVAQRHNLTALEGMQGGAHTHSAKDQRWQEADRLHSYTDGEFGSSRGDQRPSVTTGFQDAAMAEAKAVIQTIQSALHHVRPSVAARMQDAQPLRRGAKSRHQDGLRNRRNWAAARWQDAAPHSFLHTGSSGTGTFTFSRWGLDHQQAMKPNPGVSPPANPYEPPEPPCYVPPDADSVELLFSSPFSNSQHLVFTCGDGGEEPPGETVVVPIRRVYVVLNESSLRRVEGNILLPTFSMSMSIDVDSWTWSFAASLPGAALADLEPSSPGDPVLVEATINGVAYRMQIERRARDRSFAQDGLKISGRGVAAVLDSPYAPIMNHTNTGERTAQQLMNDVLTLGGVSIGWTVDWQAVDWSVPAGLFAHQGSYISALNAIASAAGSYIQPHRTAQTLHVKPRYPHLPWDWATVTPDYETPSSVATTEGIEYIEKARYNRVFVSGVQAGVLGQVTRDGTAGDLVAPMVTDPLITTAAAARQRATPVLADTGSQAHITLRMPVLAETGIIMPGKFVKYTDGAVERIGLTRAVSVDDRNPEIWQTLMLETHV